MKEASERKNEYIPHLKCRCPGPETRASINDELHKIQKEHNKVFWGPKC
jgi:hypothetical protein